MKEENGQYFPYPVTLRYNEAKEYHVYYGLGIEEVDATGGACILFKRHVYERIERPYEFTYHRDGTLNLTCDFHVFQKLQDMGFKVYIDFSILCEHLKLCKIKKIQELLANMKDEKPSE